MDITIKRELALKSLQPIHSIAEKTHISPILANVLLTVEEKKNSLWLTGTDTDIEFTGIAPLEKIITGGVTTVSAKKLFNIFKALAENSLLQLIVQDQNLVIKAQNSCFTLNTLPPEGFPNLSHPSYSMEYKLEQKKLRSLLMKTHFSMGIQDSRCYLNGVYLDIENETIKCVAMDGHRFALASLLCPSSQLSPAQIILPRKSVLELIRLLSIDSHHEMTLYIAENRVRVTADDFSFTSNLINASYPNYHRLIPQGNKIAIGERESIKQALIRVSILSNEKIRGICYRFTYNKLTITAHNLEREQAKEEVGLDYSGDDIVMAFNATYLLDVLSAITTKTIRLVLKTVDSGILIESTENEDCSYVVMPIRL